MSALSFVYISAASYVYVARTGAAATTSAGRYLEKLSYRDTRYYRGTITFNFSSPVSIFRHFSKLDHCRPEAGGDVLSGVAFDFLGADVPAGLGNYRLNTGRIIRLFVQPDQFYALLCII